MKKLALNLLTVGLFVGGIVLTESCSNECKDVVCENGGVCNEDNGLCDCTTGYEGTNCEDAWSAKFLGTWAGDDTCGFLYESTVTSSTDNELSISNIFGLAASGSADVISTTEIQIPSQTVNGFAISGSGDISGSVVTIDYKIDGDDCQVEYTIN